jgi:hypothetical protein
MSLAYSIKVEGFDELARYFKRAPQLTTTAVRKAVNTSALTVQRTARQEAPADRGKLRASIGVTFLNLGARVGPSARYAYDVHEGRRPGRVSGEEASQILDWARRKGLPGYAVLKSIERKGTRPNRFIERTAAMTQVRVQQAFDRAVDEVVEEVER